MRRWPSKQWILDWLESWLAKLREPILGSLAIFSSLLGISILIVGEFLLELWGSILGTILVNISDIAGRFAALTWGIVACFVYGIAVARHLRRLHPFQADRSVRDRTAPLRVGFVLLYALLLVSVEGFLASDNGQRVTVAIAAITLGLWDRYGTGFSIEQPFVLFLRGFGTTADRSLLPSLLGAVPPGRRAVFLVPRFGGPGQWDPLGVGLAGLKLLHPVRSMPVYLVAGDNWISVTDTLIRRAESIVIDLSHDSPAIRTELGLIIRSERLGDTLLLEPRNNSVAEAMFATVSGTLQEEPRLRWRYRTSWWIAPLRFVGGAFLMSLILTVGINSLGLSSLAEENVFMFATCLFTVPFFLKPLPTRDLHKTVARALRGERDLDHPPSPGLFDSFSQAIAGNLGGEDRRSIKLAGIALYMLALIWLYRPGLPEPVRSYCQTLAYVTFLIEIFRLSRTLISRRALRGQQDAQAGWELPTPAPIRDDETAAGFRVSVFLAWLRWYKRRKDDYFVIAVLISALATLASFFLYQGFLLTLVVAVVTYIGFFSSIDALGTFAASRSVLLSLLAAEPTTRELGYLASHIREVQQNDSFTAADLNILLLRCRTRRTLRTAPLENSCLDGETVLAKLRMIHSFQAKRSFWLLISAGSGLAAALAFEDPWAWLILGVLAGLGYGLMATDLRRSSMVRAFRREIQSSRLPFAEAHRVLEQFDAQQWKKSSLRRECREILVEKAVFEAGRES